MKKKILIISGLTSIGKSDIALKIAKILNTDIIVADSLQIYKNFPISSNFPIIDSNSSKKYHLLGKLDVLTERITTFQYKELLLNEIESILKENKVPLLEGGCTFYLNFALSSHEQKVERSTLIEAGKQAQKIIAETGNNWDKSMNILKSMVPYYDNDILPHDFYRLEKAIKYAIVSKGEYYKSKYDENMKNLRELYDIRGFFLFKNRKNLIDDIQRRCDLIIENGLLEEILDFQTKIKNINFQRYNEIATPIGFKEGISFIEEIKDILMNKNLKTEIENKKINNTLLEFASKFQIKSRQYSQYQIKYSRKKFTDFFWIDKTNLSNQDLISTIINNYSCENDIFLNNQRESFEKYQQTLPLTINFSDTKAEPLKHNYANVYKKFYSDLLPKIMNYYNIKTN